MSTNKYSKFVVDSIVLGTPIGSLTAAGGSINDIEGTDLANAVDGSLMVYDSATSNWVATTDILVDSGTMTADFFVGDGSQLTNVSGALDSDAVFEFLSYRVNPVGTNQKQVAISLNTLVDPFDQTGTDDRAFNLNYTSTTGFYVRENAGRTELHADASGSGLSTGMLLTGAAFSETGTEIAGNVKLSGLPTSDPAEAGLLWNDGGIPVFSGSTAPSGAAGIDSADVVNIVDAPYVQARQTPQDFAYSSLTGAPTALSSFTNDTNYITAADIPTTVDSDYVQARVTLDGVGLDSAGVTALVDSDYVAARAPAGGGLDSAGVQTLIDADLVGSGLDAVQIGSNSIASGARSISIGPNAAAGNQNNIAIGNSAGDAGSDPSTIAIGQLAKGGNQTGDTGSVAIGQGAGQYVQGPYTVAIGQNAGRGGGNTALRQQSGAVAAGYQSGYSEQGENGIAIGREAGWSAQGDNSIAIGYLTGKSGQGANNISINATGTAVNRLDQYGIDIRTSDSGSAVYSTDSDWQFGATVNAPAFVGDGSGLTNLPSGGGLDSAAVQGVVDDNLLGGVANTGVVIGPSASADATKLQMTVIGPSATTNGAYNVAIGRSASVQSGEENAVAIGNQARAGFSTGGLGGVSIGNSSTVQYDYGVAVGMLAEVKGVRGVALGYQAEVTGSQGIAIGSFAFANDDFSTALGQNANAYGQNSLTIGYGAGNTTGGDNTVLIGTNAGQSAHLRSTAVAVGMNAQLTNDANVSATVAVGYDAGKTRQESSTVAIGYKAGETDQLNSATAVGYQAGNTSQGVSSVAIGRDAAFTGQATNSVAIGRAAGYENQGTRSIAIGRQAGALNQGDNNIILNATSAALDRTDQFGIDIRTSAAGSLTYDTTNDWTFGAGVTMTDLTASGATVVFSNLPTTDPVNAGQLWNDGGTLKVSAG